MILRKNFLSLLNALVLTSSLGLAGGAFAGAQAEEALAPSVVSGLQRSVSDRPVPDDYINQPDVQAWVAAVSPKLTRRVPDDRERRELLSTVHYEGTRAGLDLQLLLGVIHHESGFKKYAVSVAGARGYMQVMPFWTKLIGNNAPNLFHLRTNLRYGCTILRYYLDIENGDLFRALGRYNGSLGKAEYPNAVEAAMRLYDVPESVARKQTTDTVATTSITDNSAAVNAVNTASTRLFAIILPSTVASAR